MVISINPRLFFKEYYGLIAILNELGLEVHTKTIIVGSQEFLYLSFPLPYSYIAIGVLREIYETYKFGPDSGESISEVLSQLWHEITPELQSQAEMSLGLDGFAVFQRI